MHSVTLGFVNWDKEAQKAVQRLEGMQEPPQKQQQQPGLLAVVMVVGDGQHAENSRVDDVASRHISGNDSACWASQQLQQHESGIDEERAMLLAAVVHGSSSDQLHLGTIHEEDHQRVFTVEAIMSGSAAGAGQKEEGCD